VHHEIIACDLKLNQRARPRSSVTIATVHGVVYMLAVLLISTYWGAL
jgi:hypothetical protein